MDATLEMSTNKKSRFSPFLKQCFVTAGVGCNIVGHGCVLGFPALLLNLVEDKNAELPLTKPQMSWIASIAGLTQLLGSFVTPPIMERYGRKIAHFAVIIPNLLSWFIITLSYNFEMLFAARFLQGLSIGLLSPLRSVLIGEYSSPKNRGAFLTTVSMTQSLGIFLVHLLGSLLTWQTTAIICVIFPFISLIMTIYSPESPSWLITKGRHDDCRKVFHWLRGDAENDELEEMIKARVLFERAKISEKAKHKTSGWQDIILVTRKPEFYKPIILMMHAHVLVNFAGGTTMTAYAPLILEKVMGLDANIPFWMIFLDGQRLVFNALAVFAINKFKRRLMMFITGAIAIVSQLALAGYLYFNYQGTIFWLAVLLINLKVFAVAVGMLPLPTVIGGEVFPLEYRSIGGTISLASFSGTFFLVLKTFKSLVDELGMHIVYLIYGGVLTYCMVIIWYLLPETKGKTLQQIENEFRGKSLSPEEEEELKSLQEDPIRAYKRRMSEFSVKSVHV